MATQPRTLTLVCVSAAFNSFSFPFVARVISTTAIAPSTFDARMLASDKPNRGGLSKITNSTPQFASAARKRCMAFESRNSEGFGGSGPLGIIHRFGMPTAWTNGLSDTLPAGTPFGA